MDRVHESWFTPNRLARLSILELVILRKEMQLYPEDAKFLKDVARELSRRAREFKSSTIGINLLFCEGKKERNES